MRRVSYQVMRNRFIAAGVIIGGLMVVGGLRPPIRVEQVQAQEHRAPVPTPALKVRVGIYPQPSRDRLYKIISFGTAWNGLDQDKVITYVGDDGTPWTASVAVQNFKKDKKLPTRTIIWSSEGYIKWNPGRVIPASLPLREITVD